MHVVDLFAGPGGLDVAAHWLGLHATGIEWDGDACATRDAANLTTLHGDVRAFDYTTVAASVLAAGPPCQTFTVAGTGKGRELLGTIRLIVKQIAHGDDVSAQIKELSDERSGLVLEPFRWAFDAYYAGGPYDSLVFEQVPAVLPIWTAMSDALEDAGYDTFTTVVKVEQYGVPQTRRRAVMIARRKDIGPMAPLNPTHVAYRRNSSNQPLDGSLPECVSMSDALSGVGRGYGVEHFNLVSNYGSGGDPSKRGIRHSSSPSFTITGKATRNRIESIQGANHGNLSVSDAGLFQTFPIDYPWSGRNQSQQVGNAIPPRMGVHLLASALGLEFKTCDLDSAVKRKWDGSFGCIPTTPKKAEVDAGVAPDTTDQPR